MYMEMIKCVLNNTRTVLFYLLITKLKRNVIAVIASISSADSKAVICSKSRKTKKNNIHCVYRWKGQNSENQVSLEYTYCYSSVITD